MQGAGWGAGGKRKRAGTRIQAGATLIRAMSGLFAGVEATLADEAGDDAGFDRRDMTTAIPLPNQVSG